jgi:cyanate permease
VAANRIAAMTVLVCDLTASTAPVVVGALHDLSGGYALPFGLLTILATIELGIGTHLSPALRGSVR